MFCANGHEMGPESKFCGHCGAPALPPDPLSTSSLTKHKTMWILGAGGVVAAVVVATFIFSSTSGASNRMRLVDQIKNSTCASAATQVKAHRGSIVVVHGASGTVVALGKVAAVWDGTNASHQSVCNLELEAFIPSGTSVKGDRVVVGSATPLIITTSIAALVFTSTIAWVEWSGTSWSSIQ